ncbi:hypothetical protein CYY_000402 [Polysphondylium violaceum]|uniref:Uncharacterized protein n=1 Tax=Polysphondylium violaceum TaxID=133409 RepID=A0A8J4Q3X5_9MYCE|nr:hypothetical protein CYY_000402 [Polysphondylium violaceum]
MSQDTDSTTTTTIDNNNTNNDTVVEEEAPKVYELTATDHINKNLLEMFKNRMDSGQFSKYHENNDDEDNGEFDDDVEEPTK